MIRTLICAAALAVMAMTGAWAERRRLEDDGRLRPDATQRARQEHEGRARRICARRQCQPAHTHRNLPSSTRRFSKARSAARSMTDR